MKKLNNNDLNNVSGGGKKLEDYLKTLLKEDKNKVVVDYGTGTELKPNSGIDYDDNGELIIVKREKNEFEE